MKKTVVYFLLFLGLTACEKEFYEPGDIQQEVIFKTEYINAAWGFQHSGIIINKSGEIFGFNLPDPWNIPGTNGNISSEDILENLEQATEFMGTIEAGELITYINKLYRVDPDKLGDPDHQMYDAGVTTFSGYLYNAKEDTYREVLLRQTGDVYIENYSRGAGQIYDWLMSLK